MFKWFKKMIGETEQPTADVGVDDQRSPTDTLKLVTVWDVVDRFLTQNPTATPYSVHALVEAGAADLLEPNELLKACDKIQEHGYQYPINGVLLAELHESELLQYLRWHAKTGVSKESYENEPRILDLIERFRSTA